MGRKRIRPKKESYIRSMALVSSTEYVERIRKHVPIKYRRAVACILWWDLSAEMPIEKVFNPKHKKLRQMIEGFDDPFTNEECAEIRDCLILIGYPEDEADKKFKSLLSLSRVSQERKNEGVQRSKY